MKSKFIPTLIFFSLSFSQSNDSGNDIIEYGKSQQEQIALTGQTEQKEISEADLKILHKK